METRQADRCGERERQAVGGVWPCTCTCVCVYGCIYLRVYACVGVRIGYAAAVGKQRECTCDGRDYEQEQEPRPGEKGNPIFSSKQLNERSVRLPLSLPFEL